MTNKNKVLLAVVVCLMGGLLALRWLSERAAPVTVSIVPQKPAEGVAPVSAPMAIPQSEYGLGETDPSLFQDLPTGPEPEEIMGPTDLSSEKCMTTYGKYPRLVAFYGLSLGGDETNNFALCHAAATGDDSYGGFVSNNVDRIRSRIVNSRMVYTAAKGKIDVGACSQAMAMSKLSPQNVSIKKVCEAIGAAVFKSVKSGRGLAGGAFSEDSVCAGLTSMAARDCREQVRRMKPDSRWGKNFLYLSGPSACSELSGVGKEDCLMYAGIVSGVRKGRGGWLYEAFAGKGCKRVDEELVRLYCTNKLKRRPVRPSGAGRGPEGEDASSYGE
ncbi:MAG: hypothetical protein COT18_09415 [Elusimicrobia bacterium CG08_land_8_20_14_0_20_59_10]|nr:MAG: hypothetical protein COT18_09415 [Elusimicrobia bacterium CG08_land_8_20_14_0_20_59_10]